MRNIAFVDAETRLKLIALYDEMGKEISRSEQSLAQGLCPDPSRLFDIHIECQKLLDG